LRIAISGAHRIGKTILIEELSRSLPTYAVVEEPYYLLEEEGHEFLEMPSLDDFELQLERSIELLGDGEDNQLFDRCPADFLGYLISHQDSHGFDLRRWLPRVRSAMQRLDLIVFVPVEVPDRFSPSEVEESELRRRVDEALREIVLEDRWGFGVEALAVAGTARERARQVLAYVAGRHRGEE